MRSVFAAMIALTALVVLAPPAHAAGILFAGADTEEFGQTSVPGADIDRIARGEVTGAAVNSSSIFNVPYHVNGITVFAPDRLLTGTVGSPATTEDEGQTLRVTNFAGSELSTALNPLRPTGQFNEDLGFFNGFVYAAHYGGATTGAIYKIDPNDLTSTVASFSLGFGAVGMTIVGSDIWTTDWAKKSVGIWDEGSNSYTHRFFTEGNSGALAYDADEDVLWVGQSGGFVQAFNPNTGAILNNEAKWHPFGTGFGATVDGLGFFAPTAPPGNVVPLPGAAWAGFALLSMLGATRLLRRRREQ